MDHQWISVYCTIDSIIFILLFVITKCLGTLSYVLSSPNPHLKYRTTRDNLVVRHYVRYFGEFRDITRWVLEVMAKLCFLRSDKVRVKNWRWKKWKFKKIFCRVGIEPTTNFQSDVALLPRRTQRLIVDLIK